MPVQQAVERHVWKERIDQLEAQVERLKEALIGRGCTSQMVERIAHEGSPPGSWTRLGLSEAQWTDVDL